MPAAALSATGQSRQLARQIIVALAVLLPAGIASAAIVRDWPHFELIGLAARLAILVPALAYALAGRAQAGSFFDRPHHGASRFLTGCFLAIAAVASWRSSQGLVLPDEGSYRFQARIFASGHLVAPPPPGAAESPMNTAPAVIWAHDICWRGGWYSKYPPGWPAVLALPERAGLGWLVNPVLGTLLIVIIALIARQAFGRSIVFPAIAAAALSPYMLTYSIGALSHVFAAVLLAAACLACLKGIATRRVAWFAWMYVFLICAFHVRPYAAFVSAVTLGIAALVCTRTDRTLLIRVLAFGAAAAVITAATLALYNWTYTGNPLLSPYAFALGVGVPREAALPLSEIAHNFLWTWRFAAQSTWLFSFPFIFSLAAYGFWVERKQSSAAWIFAALFCATVAANLIVNPSSSQAGERYWFEGFFGIPILGARGFMYLWQQRRPAVVTGAAVLAAVAFGQILMVAATVDRLDRFSTPRREVGALAETYRHCNCVVFLEDAPPFYGAHLNPNGPDWPAADVFYAVDPGPAERPAWAKRFGRHRWVVLTYDPHRRVGVTEVAAAR